MKRILIFSLAYYPLVGGDGIAMKEITDRIHPQDFEFHMVTLRFNNNHPKFEKNGNITVHRLGGGFGYLSKILFIPQAVIFALKNNYDAWWAMMSYMVWPISFLYILGKKKPYLITLQDGDPFEHVFKRKKIILFKPFLTYGFRHATKIQTISTFLATWARDLGFKGSIDVVPNGVDIEKFASKVNKIEKDKIVLVTSSRLVKKNAVGDIIEALACLPENYVLQICGTGYELDKLKLQAKSLKLEARIEFCGFVPYSDLPNYLQHADIFIRPSLSEGFGNSFIEAMAARLPVIATPVGGIVDFLKDRETGVFCEVSNPKSIAEKVLELTSNPELKNHVIENAFNMVKEKYDWSQIALKMKDIFEKLTK